MKITKTPAYRAKLSLHRKLVLDLTKARPTHPMTRSLRKQVLDLGRLMSYPQLCVVGCLIDEPETPSRARAPERSPGGTPRTSTADSSVDRRDDRPPRTTPVKGPRAAKGQSMAKSQRRRSPRT